MREDWIEVELDKLVSVDGLFCDGDWVESKDQDPNGDVRLIQLADIGDGRFRNKSSRFLTYKKAKELNCTFLQKGDIILARMPEPLGRATLFPLEGEDKYITVVDVAIIRLNNNNIGRKFLLYNINNPSIRKEIELLQSGTTRKRISRKNLSKIKFSIAPLPEQRAIVAKIEQLLSGLDAGIESLKKAEAQLKTYRQAVLKKAFEGELTKGWRAQQSDLPTAEALLEQIKEERAQHYAQQLADWAQAVKTWEAKGKEGKKPAKPQKPKEVAPLSEEELKQLPNLPEGWGWIRYESLCSNIRNGVSQRPDGDIGDQKIFRISAVRPFKFDMTDFRFIKNNNGRLDDFLLKKGDLLFTRYNGSRKYVGVSALFDSDEEFLYPDKLIQTRLIKRISIPSFYEFATNTFASRKFIESKIRTTAGQSGVSGSDIKAMPVPLCSLPEQQQIVQEIETRLSVCDQVEASIQTGLAKAEALRQSILKKAFEGRLLSEAELATCKNEKDWAPASTLLAQIEAEKAEAAAKAPQKASKKTKKKKSVK